MEKLPGTVLGIGLAVVALGGRAKPAGGEEYRAGTPFTYLLDTGTPAAKRPSPQALDAKAGWKLVPEDVTEHRFQGDAALLNDKLTVVLRRKGPGAEVYSHTKAGWRARAVVTAAPRGARFVTGISSIRIEENHPGAVMLDVTFEADGEVGRCSAGYRLTTGQALLEMVAGEAAERLFVWADTRYVVVPEFFGDDMVFDARACDQARFGLPTENFFINLLGGNDAIVMCVWRSGRQQTYAIATGDGPQRAIRGCEIQGGKQKTLWVALMERPGIWKQQGPQREAVAEDRLGGWEPPFPASWRDQPVWPGSNKSPNTSVIYPADRTNATPLTMMCPTDVLRNTLGVGPCQYILEKEGLASQANPTPDNVMDWVERQFERKQAEEAAEEIQELLRQMVDHVHRTEVRIGEYGALAGDVRQSCDVEPRGSQVPEAISRLRRIAEAMEEIIAEGRATKNAAERARQLADEILAKIGKQDALAECRRLGTEVRKIGSRQQTTLARCRMQVRWLKQQAWMSALRDQEGAELARRVRMTAERFLEEK